jgi:excisionase family DNA binding protein
MPIERRWLKASEVGEYLGLHPKSIYRACRHRRIPFSKIPGLGLRIDKQKLDILLERQRVNPEEFTKKLRDKKEKAN